MALCPIKVLKNMALKYLKPLTEECYLTLCLKRNLMKGISFLESIKLYKNQLSGLFN